MVTWARCAAGAIKAQPPHDGKTQPPARSVLRDVDMAWALGRRRASKTCRGLWVRIPHTLQSTRLRPARACSLPTQECAVKYPAAACLRAIDEMLLPGQSERGVMAARLVWDQVHAGSIPVSPTERAWCKGNTLAFQASAASSILVARSNAGLAQWQSAAFVKRRFAGRSRGSALEDVPLWRNG